MKEAYVTPEMEVVELGNESIITASDCDFHESCDSNCSCHFCVGVCTWDCTADDSTCTTGDFH